MVQGEAGEVARGRCRAWRPSEDFTFYSIGLHVL